MGPVAELTDSWAYSLPDGTNTQRQLTDTAGEVTLISSYTPWGDTLTAYGTGSFTYGHFGGIMDEATGLLYIGNGQYYDPATGRFLNRNAKPDQSNPYVPWKSDPVSALFAPLGLLALIFSRRKKNSRWDALILIMVLSLIVGISLSACQVIVPILNTPGIAIVTITPSPTSNSTPTYAVTITSIMPTSTDTPLSGIWYCRMRVTQTPTPTDPREYTDMPGLLDWLENNPISIHVPPISQQSAGVHACGPAALLMALRYANVVNQNYSLADIIKVATDNDYYLPNDPDGVYTSPDNMVKLAGEYTAGYVSGSGNTIKYYALDLLLDQLYLNIPVITDVTQPLAGPDPKPHYVLVTGLYIDNSENTGKVMIKYNNPWPENINYAKQEANFDTFFQSWMTNGDDDDKGNGWYMYIVC